MHALYACLMRMTDMYALYVCLICMPYMYALYVCLATVRNRPFQATKYRFLVRIILQILAVFDSG